MPEPSEWRLFTCSDCPDENDRYQLIHRVRVGAPYDVGCDVELCPRCDAYGSLLSGSTVTVTNAHGRVLTG